MKNSLKSDRSDRAVHAISTILGTVAPKTTKGLSDLSANPLILTLISGAEGRNRTADTGIFSPLLYRLSYLGKTCAG